MLTTEYMCIDRKKPCLLLTTTKRTEALFRKKAIINYDAAECNISTWEFFRYEYKYCIDSEKERWHLLSFKTIDGKATKQFWQQWRGYEAWKNSEANLLITRGLVGRLSNTPNVGFAYKIQGVVDYLTSHGVKALPGRSFSTSRLQATQPTEQPIFNKKDEEVYETLAVLIETQPGVYTNSDETAEECNYKERRKSKYKTGRWDTLGQPSGRFDYYVNYDIPTSSFNFELPPPMGWGDNEENEATKASNPQEENPQLDPQQIEETSSERYYGRIASRSGLAWKSGIEVGAGVIDSDFRGEVQLIIEIIAMPEVYEVSHLSYTERGNKGFGSTDHHVFLPIDEASPSHEPRKLTTEDIFSLLLPQEKIAALVEEGLQNSFEQDHAATTSPGASVPHSMETTLSYEEDTDSYLDYFQYLSSLSNTEPKWDTSSASDIEWTNPFANEGGGR
ncbi:hypothetical protein ZIOFF_024601 [Zingiber officinale]|uniref:dUTP diphosphatase n=1 Tax=Zingiber officinale TaxID=94328 RepID=A0A8J5H8W0_ZINOF|nr:hypothetical protein ZIOFF_024601 [Zingiber officinale]